MKKLWLAILIPVVVLVGGATTVYFLARDTSSPQYQATSDTNEIIVSRNLFNAFKDTKDTAKIDYTMSQDDFNQLLALAYPKMDDSVKEYLRGMEIFIDGENYHVYFYIKASFFKTKLDVTCTFSQDDDNFYLNITNCKMGVISGFHGIATNILKNQVGDEKIESMLAISGIHMKSDLSNNRFYYNKTQAKQDLSDLLEKEAESNSLVSAALASFIDMDIIDIDFTNGLHANIDLTPIHDNTDFTTSENMLTEENFDITKDKENLLSLLNTKIVDSTSSHPQIVFHYLIRGYDSLSEEDQSYIDKLNLSSIGITDNQTYMGSYQPVDPDIRNQISSSSSSIINISGILLKESSINEYLQRQDMIGYSYIMTYYDEETSKYAVNYIMVDNFYVNMYVKDTTQHMDLVMGLNINGYETNMILENTKASDLDYGMTLKTDNIYFGEKQVSEKLKNVLLPLIGNKLPANEFLTFDGKGTFTVNFEGYLKDYIQVLNDLPVPQKLTMNSSIEGTGLTDPGAGFRLKGKLELKTA